MAKICFVIVAPSVLFLRESADRPVFFILLKERSMSDIYAEIAREWRTKYEMIRCEAPSRSEFGDLCAAQETENRGRTSAGLQPWLGILEFGIEWLSYVHVALDSEMSVDQQSSIHRVTWALTGSAVSFGLSLRALCLSGFDTPARALLRSYVEVLLLCLAALHDEGLAQAYQDAQADAQAKTFWHTMASPKNLHNRIIQIEKNSGLDRQAILEMTEFRHAEYEILSQSAHLSYAASFLTVMAPVLGDADYLRPAIFGLATGNSVRTIRYAATTTWYFSRFGYNPILGRDSSNCLLKLDKESDWHHRIVIGRDVLSRITIGHWEK
ncbi:MAG: hypothetical protein ACLQME_23470 [Alphaproteobacteria bacterium]